MSMTNPQQDARALNEAGRELWNQKAAFWDQLHGDSGNQFHRELVSPAVERLLQLQPGERVLDVACGNGVMSRRLADLGGEVVAIDFSAALIEHARARTQPDAAPIRYDVVDATDETALVALGAFDAVVCTMGLMDMPDLAPLFRAVRRILHPGGRFVFATAHPAFNSNNPVFFTELSDENGELILRQGVKLTAYLEIDPIQGVGAPGEPNPHYYYHRPLHQLLGEAFAAGLLLDGLEEPAFSREEPAPERLSWRKLWQIPPLLVGRLR